MFEQLDCLENITNKLAQMTSLYGALRSGCFLEIDGDDLHNIMAMLYEIASEQKKMLQDVSTELCCFYKRLPEAQR